MHARAAPKFSMVVTPDRIPQFFIPHAAAGTAAEPRGERPGEHPGVDRTRRALAPSSSASDLRGTRATDDEEEEEEDDDEATANEWASSASGLSPLDVTAATLPLPHLPRITTPYGFQTLAHSPNTRRKESLFFEPGAGGGDGRLGAADTGVLSHAMTLLHAGGSQSPGSRMRSRSSSPSASRRGPGNVGVSDRVSGGGGGHLREEPPSPLSVRAISCEVLHGTACDAGTGAVPPIAASQPDEHRRRGARASGGKKVAGKKIHLPAIIRKHIPGLRLSRSTGSFKAPPSATGNT